MARQRKTKKDGQKSKHAEESVKGSRRSQRLLHRESEVLNFKQGPVEQADVQVVQAAPEPNHQTQNEHHTPLEEPPAPYPVPESRKKKASGSPKDLSCQPPDATQDHAPGLSLQSRLERVVGSASSCGGFKESKRSENLQHLVDEGTWPLDLFEASDVGAASVSHTTWSDLPRTSNVTGPSRLVTKAKFLRILEVNGVREDEKGRDAKPSEECLALVSAMFGTPQELPSGTVFDTQAFTKTSRRLAERSKASLLDLVGQLLVPRAETLYFLGADRFEHSINETSSDRSCCTPFTTGAKPKPVCSAGSFPSAFTDTQRQRLERFAAKSRSSCKVMENMFLPFLICGAKSSTDNLEAAERQNMYSAALVVRSIVQLHIAASRQKEIDRVILVITHSHNHERVKIHGHYASFDTSGKTLTHRYKLKEFNFDLDDGIDRWTSYKFVKSVYDKFAPQHLERIRMAIDLLPESALTPSN